VGALGEELAQALRRQRDRIRPRDADRVETLLARGLYQRCLERRAVF
jgi:hypothetical protein